MKVSGFCAVFLMVVIVFTFFSFSGTITNPSWFPDLVGTKCADETTPGAVIRKLKENVKSCTGYRVSLEDYNPVDPISGGDQKDVKPEPIEHGTPLMPFIPKSPPPKPAPGDYY
ncbi:unnamed protein product [Lathyrus sativus]|nr:unnamed protein product [Lathyrus sativus]